MTFPRTPRVWRRVVNLGSGGPAREQDSTAPLRGRERRFSPACSAAAR